MPDECDIATSISEDSNENGIPDECEEEFRGGESMEMGGGGEGGGDIDLTAAWQAYFEWASAQCWGPDCEPTGAEQFQLMINELIELGLPLPGR